MKTNRVKFIVVSILISSGLLLGCDSGSSSGSESDYSRNYYVAISTPNSDQENQDYSTKKKSITPSGLAAVPNSVTCANGLPVQAVPDGYTVKITNSANNFAVTAGAGILCQFGFPSTYWLVYSRIPLEIGENRLVARVSYPAEGMKGKSTQIVTREPTIGPIIEQTFNDPIFVQFDSEIDPDSFNIDTFVVKDQNMVPVTGRIEVENFQVGLGSFPDWTYSRLTFIPDFPLAPGAPTTIIISGEIKDVSGRSMGADFSWNFTTGP